jgi:indole-3-glycerol phosphate synthase
MEMCEALSTAIRGQRRLGRLAVIAELKRRRFEGVDLLRGRSAAAIAETYRSAGATALSVVTSAWFGGSLRLLAEVAAANTGLPILRKDLIRTERDVAASRRAGASAVLFVLPLLGLERLAALLQAARAESIEPFVEVSCREEIEQVRAIYPGTIAINNSDIKTNETQGAGIDRSLELIDRSDPRIWISASRIAGPADVGRLATAGFDGILIGTHLLLAADLSQACAEIVTAARSASPSA